MPFEWIITKAIILVKFLQIDFFLASFLPHQVAKTLYKFPVSIKTHTPYLLWRLYSAPALFQGTVVIQPSSLAFPTLCINYQLLSICSKGQMKIQIKVYLIIMI